MKRHRRARTVFRVTMEYTRAELAVLRELQRAGAWATVRDVHQSAIFVMARHLNVSVPTGAFPVGRIKL